MKALWLCNIVLPDFADFFNIKKPFSGGWISGALRGSESAGGVQIALCFPIIDEKRLRDGFVSGHNVYSFHCGSSDCKYIDYNQEMVGRFEAIIKDFRPDIIHIWGTEYPHSLAMGAACENLGLINRVAVNIQGLVSIIAKHYYADVPENYCNLSVSGQRSIKEDRDVFIARGRLERLLLNKVNHCLGRTDWDRACVKQINPDASYYYLEEILRDTFYEKTATWDVNAICRHSIFVSQCEYPIKGLHILLEAMPYILSEFEDAHIFAAGTDPTQRINGAMRPYGMFLKDLINKHNLNKKITFLGSLDEIQICERYLKSHVFVSASSIENSSNSIAEAMILGVPVVASYLSGTASMIEHKKTGYFYPQDAAYMLAYYVCELFADDGKVLEFSKKASARVRELKNVESNTSRLFEIYSQITDRDFLLQ